MAIIKLKNGESVFSFCKKNKIPYISVWCNIDKGLEPDEAIERAVARRGKRWADKLHYNGKPLMEYCRENGLSYQHMRRKLLLGK